MYPFSAALVCLIFSSSLSSCLSLM